MANRLLRPRREFAVNREKTIELLNTAVGDELSAIHQYLYFHFHLDDQGYDHLAGMFKRTAIQEMGHVEALADRILFLKGDIDMVNHGTRGKDHATREDVGKGSGDGRD